MPRYVGRWKRALASPALTASLHRLTAVRREEHQKAGLRCPERADGDRSDHEGEENHHLGGAACWSGKGLVAVDTLVIVMVT